MEDITNYNQKQDAISAEICNTLLEIIDTELRDYTTCKMWHGAPVWFSDGNPVVGYSVRKEGVQLMFWSGLSFDEQALTQVGDKYPTGEACYTKVSDINATDVHRWLKKCLEIQWDYKNIVKRKGELLPLKGL